VKRQDATPSFEEFGRRTDRRSSSRFLKESERESSAGIEVSHKTVDTAMSGWAPACKNFWLVARFYGPEKALFDMSWVMPAVEKAN
jgi:hypothetical protein